MKCNALITGVENIKSSPSSPKPFDFWKVNFIDTANPSGSPQSMSLPKDPAELAEILPQFQAAHLKQLVVEFFQNGKYTNFGRICAGEKI